MDDAKYILIAMFKQNRIEMIFNWAPEEEKLSAISKVSKVGDRSRGWPEGSLFNSYYTKVYGREQLQSLDCSTLPLICTL